MRRATLFVCFVLAAACNGSPSAPSATPASLGDGALVEGSPAIYTETLKALEGEPVVVNFWASWCTPCENETPLLVEAAQRYEERVGFLGVDVEDAPDAAREFLSRYDVPYPSLTDPDGEIREAQRIFGMPTTEFYRADGELAFVHRGEIHADELTDRIETLLRSG